MSLCIFFPRINTVVNVAGLPKVTGHLYVWKGNMDTRAAWLIDIDAQVNEHVLHLDDQHLKSKF